jgi:hypothetical protein
MRDNARAHKGTSLAKGPAFFIGLAALALGILGFLFADQSFTNNPVDGTVNGSSFLGIEGNGWTWALFAAGGLLLLLAAPMHWGAKTMALIVGLAFGAASVISLADGNDVFGIFAANGLTKLVWGAAAAALLLIALLPRVGKKKQHTDTSYDRDMPRERIVEREVPRERVVERPVGRAHEPTGEVVDRHRVETTPAETTRTTGSEPAINTERTGRFDREVVTDRDTVNTGGRTHGGVEPGQGRVVAPADGDGIEDRGRRTR